MRKRWVVGALWAVLMTMGLLAVEANAQAEQPTKAGTIFISNVIITGNQVPRKVLISDVSITGNQRMNKQQVKVCLRTKAGGEYDPASIDDDVRELYKTGQFSNITAWIQPDGIDHAKVFFGVRELPNTVQKVTFLGAKHIKTEELQNITGVRPSTPLNPNLNRQGCQKILDKYAEMGRSYAECHLIKGGDLTDTQVVYQITEGSKIKVRNIRFKGNSLVSSAWLRQNLSLQVGSTYNQKAAEAGINELYSYYRDTDYPDARITLEIKRDTSSGEITLIYYIHEEQRYRNGDDSQE